MSSSPAAAAKDASARNGGTVDVGEIGLEQRVASMLGQGSSSGHVPRAPQVDNVLRFRPRVVPEVRKGVDRSTEDDSSRSSGAW